MKKKRGETKDKKDVYLIDTILREQPWHKRILSRVSCYITTGPSIFCHFIGRHIPKPLYPFALNGELSNQMFQYAAAKSLSVKNIILF